jgi:L-rhamnose mutarotase
MKSFCLIKGNKPEQFENYIKYHAAVWHEIIDMIKNVLCRT